MARRFRPATEEDVARDAHRFDRLKPDGWREGFRALVLEVDGTVVGVGRIGVNPVHPRRDLVELEISPEHRRHGHGTALLDELRKYSDNPLSSKVVPGSERDLFLRTFGAVTYLEGLRADGAAMLDFDNHPTDPHTAPLLATLDREEVDPVHLVEIPGGITATLRELTESRP